MHIKVPSIVTINDHKYNYLEQINDDLYLYEEDKYKFKECFKLQDLIQIKNKRKNKYNIKQ